MPAADGDDDPGTADSSNDGGADEGLELFVGAGPKVFRLDIERGSWTTYPIGGSPVAVDQDWLVTFTTVGPGARAIRLDDPDGEPVELGFGDVAWGGAAPIGHVWQRSIDETREPRYRLREIATGDEVFALPTSAGRAPQGAFDPRIAGEPVSGIFRWDGREMVKLNDDRLLAVGTDVLLSRTCVRPSVCETRWHERSTGSEVSRSTPERQADDYVLSADGRLVAGIGPGGSSWVFDTETGTYILEDLDVYAEARGSSFSLAPDGSTIALVIGDQVVLHSVDTGEQTTIDRAPGMGRPETVLLTFSTVGVAGAARPALSDFEGSAPASASPYVSVDSIYDPSIWTARPLGPGQPLPNLEADLSLVSGDRNELLRLDLGSGVVERWDGVGVPMHQAGNWLVFSGEGTVKASRATDPSNVKELIAEPIYFDLGPSDTLTRGAQKPGRVWLRTIADDQPGSAWRLIDLEAEELLRTLPSAWWHRHTALTGLDDDVQTSESGGVFEFTGAGYEQVLAGTLKAVSDTHVLVESCQAPGRCELAWHDRDDWRPVAWPSPPAPVTSADLSAGSRVLRLRSHEGVAYIEVATGEAIHLQPDPSLRDDVSASGRYVTATFKDQLETYVVVDLDTYTLYAVPLELTSGSSQPLLVQSE